MEQIIIHQADGTVRPLIDRLNPTNIASAKQKREINNADTVSMSIQSTNPQVFNIGDWISVFGRVYRLNRLPKVKKDGEFGYTYDLEFEGIQYDLLRAMYNVNFDTTNNTIQDVTGDSLTGDLARFMAVLIANANRVFPGVWSIGQMPESTEGDVTMSFGESDNCLAVLQSLCEKFNVEFSITSNDGIHFAINMGKVGTTLPYTFRYGRGGGLYEMKRDNVSSANVITRLYAYGSTENITCKYRGTRLLLPGVSKAHSYIENAQAMAAYGLNEAVKIFDDVKPTYQGRVTAVNASDVLQFTDANFPFDLNELEPDGVTTKYLIDGVAPKIHFNTGNLAGFELEIHKYDHATRTFTLIKQTDERGNTFPSAASTAFQFAVTNEYKILDVAYSDDITNQAEERLREEATTYLEQNCQPKVQYSVGVSKMWLQRHVSDVGVTDFFVPGDYIHIVDEGIGVDKSIRIKAIERNILDPYSYTLTVSDTVTTQLISRVISDSIELDKIIQINDLKNHAKARANWLSSREVLNMVFDVEGDYYTDKIKPESIDTTMLSVGAKSMQFGLVGVTISANASGNPANLQITGGQLVHYAIEEQPRTWVLSPLNLSNLVASKAYYIYAVVQRGNNGGTWMVTDAKVKYDAIGTSWVLLVGVLNSVDALTNTRTIYTMYGFTTINGRFIRTGRIQSADGDTYFDLDLGEIGGVIKFTRSDGSTGNVADLDAVANESKDFINNTLPGLLEGIQAQLDGQIEQFFEETDPIPTSGAWDSATMNEPFKTWYDAYSDDGDITHITNHLGDLYYNTENGKVFRLIEGWYQPRPGVARAKRYWWSQLADEELAQALQLAQDALDLADDKRRIFVSTPYPPYEIGDLWVQGSGGDIMVCKTERLSGNFNAADWEKSSKYTDDSALNDFINGTFTDTISDIQDQVDGKIEVWFQTSDPSTAWTTNVERQKHVGDMWYNSAANLLRHYTVRLMGERDPQTGKIQIVHVYSWEIINDQKALDAYAAASQAQDTADGKRTVFVAQPTASDSYDVGDLWVNCNYNSNGVVYNNDLLRCVTAKAKGVAFSITHWALATAYDNTKTTIDGGVVTSGTIRLAGDDTTIKAGITGKGTADTAIRIWAGATEQNKAVAPCRVNQGGEVWMTNAHISGEVNATSGSIRNMSMLNVKISGALRSPFSTAQGSFDTGYSDNVVMMSSGGGWIDAFSLPWDALQSGRRITLVNYKWGSTVSDGVVGISAPSGKWFFIEGQQKNELQISREAIELLGYGDSQNFYGWIVMARIDLMPRYSYGHGLKVLAMGKVTGTTSGASLSYKSFDGKTMSVTRVSQGKYRINFPTTWFSQTSDCFVMVTPTSLIYGGSNPNRATVTTVGNGYFEVILADDFSLNDGNLNFTISNFNDMW